MDKFKIGSNIASLRGSVGMSQDQLAEVMNVTKSAVSKWESNTTLPDVTTLARLASYFQVSLDELVGYEPELTKAEINRIYDELSKEFAGDPEAAMKHCESLIAEYYCCLPFIEQMAALIVNHHMLLKDQNKALNRVIELCTAVRTKSSSPGLIKEAASFEALALISLNQPDRVIELINRDNEILDTDMEFMAQAYVIKGENQKAAEIFEMTACQHLIFFVQDSLSLMMMIDEKPFKDETLRRIFEVVKLYGIEKLHPNTACAVYFSAASVYAARNEKDRCIKMLELFAASMEKMMDKGTQVISSDGYFKNIDKYVNQQILRRGTPRSKKVILESAAASIKDNPVFKEYISEPAVQKCLNRLTAAE